MLRLSGASGDALARVLQDWCLDESRWRPQAAVLPWQRDRLAELRQTAELGLVTLLLCLAAGVEEGCLAGEEECEGEPGSAGLREQLGPLRQQLEAAERQLHQQQGQQMQHLRQQLEAAERQLHQQQGQQMQRPGSGPALPPHPLPRRVWELAVEALPALSTAAGRWLHTEAQERWRREQLLLCGEAAGTRACAHLACPGVLAAAAESRAKGKRCTGCNSVRYCGVKCQRADWKLAGAAALQALPAWEAGHKAVCAELARRG